MDRRFALVALVLTLLAPLRTFGQVIDLPDRVHSADRGDAGKLQEELPSPEEIIERHIEATGGRDAYERIRNRKVVGTFRQDDTPEAPITIHSSPPNNRHVQVGRPGGGRMLFVTNSKESWTYEGANVVAAGGEQRTQEIRRAAFDIMLSWKRSYQLASTVGVEDVNGRPAYKLRLTAEEDCHQVILLFDQETGRHVRTMQDIAYAGMTIRAEATVSEYVEYDGVALPTRTHRVLQYPGGRNVQHYEMTSVEHNLEMDEAMFATPPELG